MTDHNGRVALITAASRGIGFGAAKALANVGARVAICARNEDALGEAARVLADQFGQDRVFALPGDVGDEAFLHRLVAETENRFVAPIDILINNNGGPPAGPTLDIGISAWRQAIDRNLLSVVTLCTLIAPGMKRKKWGRIVNLTSLTAKEPSEDMALSSVTRAGVSAYSKTLARELAPLGITVNTILTGACLTERLLGFLRADMETTGETMEQIMARVSATIPAGFIPDPDQFALVILFLTSSAASFLTGLSLPVDGGASRSTF
jgi:3-oxoacyl-[acyl-carrier protein] reductase